MGEGLDRSPRARPAAPPRSGFRKAGRRAPHLGRRALGMDDAAPGRHPVHLARVDRLLRAEAVAVHDLAIEQISDGGKADVRMRAHVDAGPGLEHSRSHLVKEDKGSRPSGAWGWGSARRTSNRRDRWARGTITVSIKSVARASPGVGSGQGCQLMISSSAVGVKRVTVNSSAYSFTRDLSLPGIRGDGWHCTCAACPGEAIRKKLAFYLTSSARATAPFMHQTSREVENRATRLEDVDISTGWHRTWRSR